MNWDKPVTNEDLDTWLAMAEAAPEVPLGAIDWPMIVRALIAHIRAGDSSRIFEDRPVRHGSPSQQLQELHAKLDAGAEEAMKSVGDGEPDGIFKSGYYMGVQVGMGLASAYAIKEMQLRDERRSAGEGELYKRHDYRAQAFDQLARALNRWLQEH